MTLFGRLCNALVASYYHICLVPKAPQHVSKLHWNRNGIACFSTLKGWNVRYETHCCNCCSCTYKSMRRFKRRLETGTMLLASWSQERSQTPSKGNAWSPNRKACQCGSKQWNEWSMTWSEGQTLLLLSLYQFKTDTCSSIAACSCVNLPTASLATDCSLFNLDLKKQ